ncbi:AAA family ATPase [Actinocrispum wychmicini]|uniref:2-phosphoglycerate kinase n=1 Tax=Actinocrispum wychmicini TaxID=1213861 RepID=A0A4R2JBA6_9PSEU|nr:AAA family ATPase [Actinocrispum wychmicini]TCO56761.1 2-phosphoglycerate kinase [Actinocrispum wychmicini]
MELHKVNLEVLYGIPCVGKSTMAINLAHQRGIRTVITTDYVREVQRMYVPRNEAPALAMVTHDAWQLFGPPTRSNVERGFLDHVQHVLPGVKAVAAKVVKDGLDAVMEGAHFHSAVINELRDGCPNAQVSPRLLAVDSAAELLRRIASKESRRVSNAPKKQWSDHVDVMMLIQDFLIDDAESQHIPVITEQEWSRQWVPV